ncbi:MAG: aminoacetone oxidase family FAD-binding enzyme, partial [Clostridia bacterium]|nr:aminoacetone oxidase family FAD-binding enzyme [Clostridia bacterium]
GEMLFTHYGVSGPIILSASCILNKYELSDTNISIDLKPALNEKMLNDRLLREFSSANKNISTVMRTLVPSTMIEKMLDRINVRTDKRCNEITKRERESLVKILKNLEFTVKALRPIEEAIVTSGGVSVKEINPKTMESKIIRGLYFAGEIIDVDAFTGGFNIQIAFSTGFVAGKNA